MEDPPVRGGLGFAGCSSSLGLGLNMPFRSDSRFFAPPPRPCSLRLASLFEEAPSVFLFKTGSPVPPKKDFFFSGGPIPWDWCPASCGGSCDGGTDDRSLAATVFCARKDERLGCSLI